MTRDISADEAVRLIEDRDGHLGVVAAESGPDGRRSLLARLSAAAPPDRTGTPRLGVPEGWVELKAAGAHQMLVMELGEVRGVSVSQVLVARVGHDGGPAASRPGSASLVLAVERWSSGAWHGVHTAWLRPARGGMVLHRLWELPLTGGGAVAVSAQYPPALARGLDHRVDTMVAGLGRPDDGEEPAGADEAEVLYRGRLARRSVPGPLPHAVDIGASGLDWIGTLGHERRGRLDVAPVAPPRDVPSPALVGADGRATETALHLGRLVNDPLAVWDLYRTDARGSTFRGRFWQGRDTVMAVVPREAGTGGAGGAGGARRGLGMGLYPRADLAELVLRAAGHVAAERSEAPRRTLTWEQLTGEDPLPEEVAALSAGAAGERHVWQLVPLDPAMVHLGGAGRVAPDRGILQAVSIPGAGHFLMLPDATRGQPAGYGLEAISGLALYQAVRTFLSASGAADRGEVGRSPH